jgi:type I restriction enzyme S subunit
VNGWQTRSLGELSTINYGYTEKANWSAVGPRFLRITDIQAGGVDWASVPYCPISERDKTQFELRSGDIVFARTGATTGKSFLIVDPPEAVFASYLIRLRISHKNLLPEFVSYFFQTKSYWDSITLGIAGSAQGGFNASKLAEMRLAFPPLPEQRRIVAILDEAFAALEAMRANAERNLQNSHELFDNYLDSLLTQDAENQRATTIGQEANILVGFAFKSGLYTNELDGIKLLRGDNVVQGRLRWDEVKLWPAERRSEYSEYELRSGDIVLAMDRTWVKAGLKFAQLSGDDLPSLLVQRVARLRVADETNRQFMFNVIGSRAFTRYVLDIQTGLGVPHISGNQIASFAFGKPPQSRQREMVAAIEYMREETARLASLYTRKFTAIAELKQSLLQKAFTGQLTSTQSLAA